MDDPTRSREPQLRQHQGPEVPVSYVFVYSLAILYLIHHAFYRLDFVALTIGDFAWNVLIYTTPSWLLLNAEDWKALGEKPAWSQVHAAKATSVREMLGIGGLKLVQHVPATAGFVRRMSLAASARSSNGGTSEAPPGLGNWDNSCYQNSVLQGLSSLGFLEGYLREWSKSSDLPKDSTVAALEETTARLRDTENNGKRLWTPAKLKSMSSWQQQDAQEYFSKIMDELDKEAGMRTRPFTFKSGLESAALKRQANDLLPSDIKGDTQNPLEGLLTQQVVCTACGFSEGISMIPFNCLTLPLGQRFEYDLTECLDEYTKLEPITDVECAKCTLLKAKSELERLCPPAQEPSDDQQTSGTSPDIKAMLKLPPELRLQISQRLAAVQEALQSDDFSDEIINQRCQISKKARVCSTKTRQGMVARSPKNLVIHVNRSVFDESTGIQSKNYAAVRYPETLDLGPWVMGYDKQQATTPQEGKGGLPREDLWKYVYRLRAVVTHYGRHENGHYIAYRQSPTHPGEDEHHSKPNESTKQLWWRLSDDEVYSVSREHLLNQGGVFMLFYERDVSYPHSSPPEISAAGEAVSASIPDAAVVAEITPSSEITTPEELDFEADAETTALQLPIAGVFAAENSEASATEDESEADTEDVSPATVHDLPKPSPHTMRTASARISSMHNLGEEKWGFGRVVAAT